VFFSFLAFGFAQGAPYCLYIGKWAYTKENTPTIKKVLERLPESSFKLEKDGRLSVYSGHFEKAEEARLLLPLLQSRYPSARLTQCEKATPYHGILPKPPKTPILDDSQSRLVTEGAQKRLDLDSILLLRLKSDAKEKKLFSFHPTESSDFKPASPAWQTGWYIRNNLGYDSINHDTSYDVRLEWDLFKDGYMEAKHRRELIAKRSLWRRWNDRKYEMFMRKRELLSQLKRYRYEAQKEMEGIRYAFYRYLYKEAKKAYEEGALTRFDLRDINASLRESEDKLAWYNAKTREKMPLNVWRLFARCESVTLRPTASLFGTPTPAKGYEQNLTRMRPLWERWGDRLRLNLYAGYRNLYVNQDQALVGFDAKIPLFVDDETERLDNLYYGKILQRETQEEKMRREDFEDRRADFLYHQRRIRALKRRLEEIGLSLKELTEIEKSRYAPYMRGLYRRKEQLVSRYLDRLRELMEMRFEALSDLYSLSLLAQKEPSALLETD